MCLELHVFSFTQAGLGLLSHAYLVTLCSNLSGKLICLSQEFMQRSSGPVRTSLALGFGNPGILL